MTSGWRNATGACLGIAAANGILITAAFSGISLITHPTVLAAVQLAGGAFVVYLGIAFVRSKTHFDPVDGAQISPTSWATSFGLGIASGLLNPKNALFYLSLAAALAGASTLTLVGYGVWMFTIVLAWDVFIAVALGSERALAPLSRHVWWLTKVAGAVLILFGGVLLVTAVWSLLA